MHGSFTGLHNFIFGKFGKLAKTKIQTELSFRTTKKMSDTEIDDLELTFERLMSERSVEPLQNLAASMGIEERHWRGKKQTLVMKALRREMESKEEVEDRK